MVECLPKGWKTPWAKQKLLKLSNFSFSNSVFKRLILQTCENMGLLGTRGPFALERSPETDVLCTEYK